MDGWHNDGSQHGAYNEPMRCTLLFLDQRRNVLPFHQNKIPKRHHRVISAAFVMIGSMKLHHVSTATMQRKEPHKLTLSPKSKA